MVRPLPRLACYDGEGVSYQVHEAGREQTLLHHPLLSSMSCEKDAGCTGLCSQGRLRSRKLTRTPSRILQETNHGDSVSQLSSLLLLVPRFHPPQLHPSLLGNCVYSRVFVDIHCISIVELLSVAQWLPVFNPQLAAHWDAQFEHIQPISWIFTAYSAHTLHLRYLQDDWDKELGGAFRAHAVRPKTAARQNLLSWNCNYQISALFSTATSARNIQQHQTQVREIFLSADLAEHRGWSIALVITSVSSFSKGSAQIQRILLMSCQRHGSTASECQNNGSWFTNSLFIWVKVLLVGNCSGWATDWWFVRI